MEVRDKLLLPAVVLSSGEVQTFLKLNSRPQHPLSGRDVTLVTERELFVNER